MNNFDAKITFKPAIGGEQTWNLSDFLTLRATEPQNYQVQTDPNRTSLLYVILRVKSQSTIKIEPFIRANIANRYLIPGSIDIYSGTLENAIKTTLTSVDGVFSIGLTQPVLKSESELGLVLNYNSGYTITVEKLINGSLINVNYDPNGKAISVHDMSPFIKVSSTIDYVSQEYVKNHGS